MQVDGFEFPDNLHYLVGHDVWVRPGADGIGTVGITTLGIALAGEIYMCRPKGPGTAVEFGRSIAVVELAKSIVSVKSPVSGVVLVANPRLEAEPELVHADPYGEGWLARVHLSAWPAEAGQLIHGDAVREAMAHQIWLHRAERPE